MAYQPKFARKKDRVSPFFVLLGVIVVPISLALTAVLLGKMAQSLSRPKAAAQTAPADMAIMDDDFDRQRYAWSNKRPYLCRCYMAG